LLIYGIKKLKLACSRQPEYRDPATLFAGPILCLVSWRKGDLANFGCLPRLVGPANEKGTHSAHQMLRAK